MNLCFKDAELAAQSSNSWMGAFFSRAIKWKTGGRFSHTELWLAGPKESATCFSSREPGGTGYAVIDLSEMVNGQPLWTCIEIPMTPQQMYGANMFVAGIGTRRYDFLGILGFCLPQKTNTFGTPSTFTIHDPTWLFCSETCCMVLQAVLGWFVGVKPWTISPSALYEMVQGVVKERV